MMKRILVGLGGTPYVQAKIEHAIDLARRHGAEVTGVTIVDAARIAKVGAVPIGGAAAAHELREHRERTIREHLEETIAQFETMCTDAAVRHQVVHETGDPFDELASLWRYHDLTILGLQGFFDYDVFEAADDHIAKVIARGVRPIIASAKTFRTVRKALVAYNGSMESAKAMKRFVQMRLWDPVELLIACFDLPEETSDALLRDARDYCVRHEYRVETFASPGDPHVRLLEYAQEWQADILVMGSTNRGRLARLILGDTLLHTIRQAEIPLFLAQ